MWLGKALQPSSFILSWAVLNQLQTLHCSLCIYALSFWNILVCTAIPVCFLLKKTLSHKQGQQPWPVLQLLVLQFLGSCINLLVLNANLKFSKERDGWESCRLGKTWPWEGLWATLIQWNCSCSVRLETWQLTIHLAWLSVVCELSVCHTGMQSAMKIKTL